MEIAKRNARTIGYALLFLALVSVTLLLTKNQEPYVQNIATVSDAKTIAQLLQKRTNYQTRAQSRSAERLVNVLIVPGHDDEHVGTWYKNLREVDLNRQLAENLYEYLLQEEGINPVLASDTKGYNPIFDAYFVRERDQIEDFMEKKKEEFDRKIASGEVSVSEEDFHNPAPGDMALRLYGINRWVNEADFDLVIHIHFNDHAGRNKNRVGKNTGFSIYTPSQEFENYELSRRLADSVFAELKKIRPVSDLKAEEAGVIEDRELIALGSNESLEAGSILVEYGYIYESIFTDSALRKVSLDNMAYATYAGIKNLLGENPMPKENAQVKTTKNKTTAANLEWQFQKAFAGEYPPAGETLRDCPIAGFFGACSARTQ